MQLIYICLHLWRVIDCKSECFWWSWQAYIFALCSLNDYLRFNPQGKSPRNDAAEFNEKRVYRNWCIGRLGDNICRLGVCSNSSKFVGIIHFHEKQVTKDAETFHDYQSCCVWLFVRSYGAFTCSFYLLDRSVIAFYVFKLLNKFTKTASLLTLGLIALERMHAIVWPFRHRVLRIYVYKAALVFTWALPAALTAILSLKIYNVRFEAALPATVFFVTIEMAASYITLWVFIKRRRPQHDTSTSQDKALAFTLLLISGAFVVTWVIPVLFISIPRICTTCHQPKGSVILWLHVAFAFQSVINPVIYCFRIPGFQDILKAKIKQMNFFGKRMQQQPTENDMRDYK